MLPRGNGMSQRKKINQQIDERLTEETAETIEAVKGDLIEEYKQLSDKCDAVIAKIKTRKVKKTPSNTEAK